jgi:membrane-associated phospholipid phosphatase
MDTVAKLISAFLHPFVMPAATLMLLLHFDIYLSLRIEMFIYLALVISINSIAPAISLWFMYKRNLISDLDIRNRKERVKPFLIVLSYYTLAYILTLDISGVSVPELYRSLMLGLVLSIFAGWLITLKFKISMHMLASGGVLAAILISAIRLETLDLQWIAGIIISGGIVGWSRVYLGAHTLKEVYSGYAVGFCCVGVTMFFGLG